MIDPYVYEKTTILKNKKNIKVQEKLDSFESLSSYLGISKIRESNMKINSLFKVKEIHKIIFNDVYDWAGEYRIINIYKNEPVLNGLSVNYSQYNNIEKDIKTLDEQFKNEKWSILRKSNKLDKLIYYFSSLWRIHPFREGNTRTVSLMLFIFAKQIGFKLDEDLLAKHCGFFRNALVMASIDEYSELKHIKLILGDALSFKMINENKYQTINGYKVEKYKYQPHHVKE